MGKKSKRVREGSRVREAPTVLAVGEQRYFDPQFLPMRAPQWLLETEEAKTLDEGIASGWLLTWEVGRKGTHIASRWVSSCGNEDTMVSPDPGDEDLKALLNAHCSRLAQWAGLWGSSSSMA